MLYKFNKKQGAKYEHDVNMCNVIVFADFIPISNPVIIIDEKMPPKIEGILTWCRRRVRREKQLITVFRERSQ